ncbi:MAG: hypothetical protein HY601_01420 [Candidatus Omnitrophica bacterium]|nr:hypothetical protein [Candidatus Omnitrophota bacterium]
MAELTTLIHRITSRYRRRLLAQAAVWAGLTGGFAWLLGARLRGLGVAPLWSAGAPLLLAALGAGWLGLRLQRRWVSPHGAAAYLDRLLGLQQRLTTAAQFAAVSQAPALYPRLLEETQQVFDAKRVRMPRPLNRPALLLVALLLLLFLLPLGRASRPGVKLASRPPQEPPASTTQDDRESGSQQGQGGSSGESSGSSQGAGDSSGGQQSQSSSGRDGQASQGRDASQGKAGGQSQAQSQAEGKSGSSGSQDGRASQAGQQAGAQQAGAQQHQTQQASGSQQNAGARSAAAGQPQPRPGAERGSSEGTAQAGSSGATLSAAQQEALKAEIQELLKEVSGQLKQLETQLASQPNQQPQPNFGTTTDPSLYDAPEPLGGGGSQPLPIQLETDTQATSGQRKGGGVGAPSGEVSGAAPQVRAQEAQLSDQPLAERAASRQPVPPEYRSIFERLQGQAAQPRKESP